MDKSEMELKLEVQNDYIERLEKEIVEKNKKIKELEKTKENTEIELKSALKLFYNQEQKNKSIAQDNLDLKRLYERTAKKLIENGHEDLANYFLAQIGMVPTWSTMDDKKYDFIFKDKIKEVRDKTATYAKKCQAFSVDKACSEGIINFIDYILEEL